MRKFWRAFLNGVFVCILLLALALGVCYFGGLFEFTNFGKEKEEKEIPTVTVVVPEKTEETQIPRKEENTEAEGMAAEAESEAEIEEAKPIEEAGEVRLLFAGDLYFTELLQDKYRKNGIGAAASRELLDFLQEADFFALNQEFPFGTTGEAMEEKQYTFRISPDLVRIPKELGVDLVTLANNHVLDFGREPLSETLKTLDQAGIAYVGAGENLEEAGSFYTFETQGRRLGFLGASRVIPESSWNASRYASGVFTTYDASQLIAQIQKAKKSCDFVVVLVHWGVERSEEPEDYQKSLARQYIEAGADAVIGSHPHVLQGIEFYQGKPIFYSLGNFIFSNRDYESQIAELTLTGEKVEVRMIPCVSRSNQMGLMSDTEKYFSRLQELSFGVTVDEEGRVREM